MRDSDSSPLIVGLTGGIGSGKTTVSDRFKSLGIQVIDADVVARQVVEPGSEALAAITEHFGAALLTEDGSLDRASLRQIIFSNEQEKSWLENLLHPLINTEIRSLLSQASSAYAILSSPLLLETQQHQLVDRILVVDTSEQLQIERASARDNAEQSQIHAIIASQMSRMERCNRANDIIQNYDGLNELYQQTDKLHQLYLEIAATED